MTIINQLCVSKYYWYSVRWFSVQLPITNHGIGDGHCQAMSEHEVCELAHSFFPDVCFECILFVAYHWDWVLFLKNQLSNEVLIHVYVNTMTECWNL